MQRTRMLAGTALAALSLQVPALAAGQHAHGCPPGKAGAEPCARAVRVRVELPPSPAVPAPPAAATAPVVDNPDARTVSTLPQPDAACRAGTHAGHTTTSSGHITRAGC